MRIVAISTLRTFWNKHSEVEQPLKAWVHEVEAAEWKNASQIKARFGSASILPNRRVVFNIKGNQYRLIVSVAYRLQVVYVKFIGTHAQYDVIDATTVDQIV